MAFLDDFKRSATDVANKAVKKTEEITGVAKLQVSVKTNEAKLSGVYKEIGRLFYTAERSGVDFTAEIASNIMKADKLKADIDGAKAEIAKLRRVVICEGCNNEISDTAAFCSYCGMKQIKATPAKEEEPVSPEATEETAETEDTTDAE